MRLLPLAVALLFAPSAGAAEPKTVQLAPGITLTTPAGQEEGIAAMIAYRSGDYATAARLMQQAADLGHLDSMRNLGNLYETGSGVPKDLAKALEWYMKAAEAGDGYAFHKAGALHYHGSPGIPKDLAKAYELMLRGAALGDDECLHQVGYMTKKGIGTTADPAAAVAWFRKAAEAGNAKSMHSMGIAHMNGEGVTPDPVVARGWFERAAEAGSTDSMLMVAQIYIDGAGVAADHDVATEWLKRAVRAGNSQGQEILTRYGIAW